jgi:hypothetical protein
MFNVMHAQSPGVSWRYDPETNKFDYILTEPNQVAGAAVVPHGGKLLAIGGEGTGIVQTYHPETNYWSNRLSNLPVRGIHTFAINVFDHPNIARFILPGQ